MTDFNHAIEDKVIIKNNCSFNIKDYLLGNYEVVIRNYKPQKQKKEDEFNHREYKRHFNLSNIKNLESKIYRRCTQMIYRLNEGCGKATYYIGIEDNGCIYGLDLDELINSIFYFEKVINLVKCKIKKIILYQYNEYKNIKYVMIIKLTSEYCDITL